MQMARQPLPLIPVGRDCDCGHPLVWRAGQQWCAVYGSHPVEGERLFYTDRRHDQKGAA